MIKKTVTCECGKVVNLDPQQIRVIEAQQKLNRIKLKAKKRRKKEGMKKTPVAPMPPIAPPVPVMPVIPKLPAVPPVSLAVFCCGECGNEFRTKDEANACLKKHHP